jgi:threonine/homoserine/homoserine lactone efflux protein
MEASKMHDMMAIAGLVVVAAITPGPNNFIVLRAAGRAGIAAAVPAIAGVVTGGLVLLALVTAGAGAVLAAEPRLRAVVAVGGSLYLSWLGLRLVRGRAGRDPAPPGDAALPSGALGVFWFQLVNPKGWVMVMTASAASSSSGFWSLLAVFAVVPAVCLTLWAAFGSAMAGLLARPRFAARFDRAMGALLIASAVALAVQNLGGLT